MTSSNEKTKLEASSVYNLKDLVDYSEDAVVSRTLMKNSGGTVTLFSFDEGQNLSEHSTPFDALVQVLDGEVELVIGGKKVITKIGEITLMPANIPHAVNAVKKFKMILTMLKN